ncbi:MAG TPA: polysaccharide deacetylase family protein, partial [Desulfosarcina sp.]|nr:polysaccharide deacetylase family protein [Desulfosarcina sp.]
QDGFVIGCRGENGRSLARRKPGQSFEANFKWIESELEKAKAAVENHLGTSCRFLAYPQGGSNGLIAAMAAKVGFAAGFTLDPGDNPFFTDRFRIHRIAVDKRSGPEQFAGRLTTLIETDLK